MRCPSATVPASQDQSTQTESHGSQDPWAPAASPYDRDRWLTESLPLLEGIGPLLPGAADKRPTVGDEWQQQPGWSLGRLHQSEPETICWHIGADATHAAVDVDGAKAAAFCQSHGCDPYTADTWRIIRTGNTERLKLVFTVTPEQKAALVAGAKTVKIEGQELAVFAKPGTQIVVLGNHYTKESNYTENDDQYAWAGRAPADAQPMPPEWFALLTGVFCGERLLRPPTRRAVTASSPRKANAYSCSSGKWSNSSTGRPCPICGRDHSGACSTHADGKSVWCCHGETKTAPDCSKAGEKITGRDGQTWGYVRTEEHDSFGERSLFVLDKPRERSNVVPLRPAAGGAHGRQEQQAHGDEQQEHPSSFSKPLTMATHAVLIQLPQRIGQPRLNVRTRDVHLPERIISADEASRLYLQLSSDREKWPKETTFDAVQLLADGARFDPVAEYLEGLEASTEPLPIEEWQRLDQLLFNIDDPVAAAFLPRFFITAVARTFQPGCFGRQWPVLIGEKGIGKSDLPKLLFNIPGLPEGFVDNPGDLQRDGLLKAHRSWCVELAELNGISRRADKEHLKAFLSERTDTYRAPYSRAPASHPRRFVFWGTSNGPPMNEADPRFVCIPLPDRMLPFAAVEAAKDALWARALQQYRAGTCWHTVGDEFKSMLRERNEDHTVTDPWADQVARNLDFRRNAGSLPVSIPELMDVLTLDSNQRNNAVAVRLIELAGSLGWVKGRRRPAQGMDPRQGLWPKDWK